MSQEALTPVSSVGDIPDHSELTVHTSPGVLLAQFFYEYQDPQSHVSLSDRKKDLCPIIQGIVPYVGRKYMLEQTPDLTGLLPKRAFITYNGPYALPGQKPTYDMRSREWLVQGSVEQDGLYYDVEVATHRTPGLRILLQSDHDLLALTAEKQRTGDIDFRIQSAQRLHHYLTQYDDTLEFTHIAPGKLSNFLCNHPNVGSVFRKNLQPVGEIGTHIFAK